MNTRKIILALSAIGFMSSCQGKHGEPNIEIVQNMMESPAIKAQDYDRDIEDMRANTLPPEGTVPVGFTPYKYATPDEAEKAMTNPFAGRKELITAGQKQYMIYCSVCHGPTGRGDGTVADKLQLAPPSLLSSRVRAWKDGYLYHMIVMGRGLMGGYGNQISKIEDRWALVNYIRHMNETQAMFPAAEAGGK